ncbi:hypothetical protein FRB93_004594 [Tulasnella sp. JGI-2019a]|nr:hypothetical protein FRB93_004594 [Tulasnella sp. JGI-2019a]
MFSTSIFSALTALLFLAPAALGAPITAGANVQAIAGPATSSQLSDLSVLLTMAKVNIETKIAEVGCDSSSATVVYTYVKAELTTLETGVAGVCAGKSLTDLGITVTVTTPITTPAIVVTVGDVVGLLAAIIKIICEDVLARVVGDVAGILALVGTLLGDIAALLNCIICSLKAGLIPDLLSSLGPLVASTLDTVTSLDIPSLLNYVEVSM